MQNLLPGTVPSSMTSTSTVAALAPAPLFIATYPPQKCGIATFTRDLVRSVAAAGDGGDVMVVTNDGASPVPNLDSTWSIERNAQHDYSAAAHRINSSRFDVVNVQHEFGIFGGDEGGYILDLMSRLNKPVVTTLHTVLASPNARYRGRLLQIVEASDRVVVLTDGAVRILRDVYGVASTKVRMIPHGIPDIPMVETGAWKLLQGFAGRFVLATFGLIGPSKGIDDMIDALPELVRRNPNIIYLIVGETHPGVIVSEGESYRRSLQKKVADLGLVSHVRFIDRYLPDSALIELLKGVDIYVTPYPNRDQISSGTLALAAGLGKPIVATRFHYAVDMLSEGRGILVDFSSPRELGKAIQHLVDNPTERAAMRQRIHAFSRSMTWGEVASQYRHLFGEVRRRPNVPMLLSRREASLLIETDDAQKHH